MCPVFSGKDYNQQNHVHTYSQRATEGEEVCSGFCEQELQFLVYIYIDCRWFVIPANTPVANGEQQQRSVTSCLDEI